MYFYIYDSFLVGKKYTKLIDKVETRVASLDIAGKKIQLSILKNITEIIEDIFKKNILKEPLTVVVIGGDTTFYQAALPLANKDAVLGFIPVEPDSAIANILGLPVNEYAADVISARLIEKISFGKINGEHFFSSLEFPVEQAVLTCDGKYQIKPKNVKIAKVINLDLLQFTQPSSSPDFKRMVSNPQDDYLEVLLGNPGANWLLFKKKEKKDSLFFVKTLKIESKKPNEEILITADGKRTIKTPALVEIAPEFLKVIVGKDRLI